MANKTVHFTEKPTSSNGFKLFSKNYFYMSFAAHDFFCCLKSISCTLNSLYFLIFETLLYRYACIHSYSYSYKKLNAFLYNLICQRVNICTCINYIYTIMKYAM